MCRPVSVMLIAGLMVQGVALGADKTNKADIDRTKRLWNPDVIMQQACDGISRHYNLDDNQKGKACGMLTEGVTKFLENHDKDVWPILAELVPYQLTGEQPDAATAKRIANRGHHIFEEAKQEILKAQSEFRKLLRDDQKRIHDRDLKALNKQLDAVDQKFKNWKEGKVEEGGPLDRVYVGGAPLTPINARPPQHTSRGVVSRRKAEDDWDRYVRSFIENYRLDESQSKSAQQILKDMKDKAKNYRVSNDQEIKEAEQMLATAKSARPVDLNSVELAQTIVHELKKPFEDYFEQLKVRLNQIPTAKQREEYYQRNPNLRPAAKPAADSKPKVEAKKDDKPASPAKPPK